MKYLYVPVALLFDLNTARNVISPMTIMLPITEMTMIHGKATVLGVCVRPDSSVP